MFGKHGLTIHSPSGHNMFFCQQRKGVVVNQRVNTKAPNDKARAEPSLGRSITDH
jgi:hypothetical protein